MSEPTPQDWQDLYERTQQTARDLARLIEDIEDGYVPTPEEMRAIQDAGADIAAANRQLQALHATMTKFKAMAAQAPYN